MRLKTKVLLAFVPLSLLAAGLIATLERRAVRRILVDELAQRVLGRTSEFAPELALEVQARDENTTLSGLHSFTQQTHASYAVALDTAGVVVAHTNVVEHGKTYRDAATLQALARQEPGYRMEHADGRETLDVEIPLWERNEDFLLSSEGGLRRVGTLRIGLPLDDAMKTESRIVRELSAVLALAGGGALTLILLLTARVLKPILPLTRAAAQIGQGRYGVTVPILSRDELGELGESFNRMSAALSATTVSKRFLDDILNSMLDSLIVLDAADKIRLANAAACRLLGRPESDILGLHESQLFAEAETAASSVASRGNVEVDLRGADGEKIPVLLSSSPIADSEGRPSGAVLVARDIRERKALESRMAQSEKLSAIGQLAAGVAHEINNPLGVILGFAQSVSRKVSDGDPLSLPLRSIAREALRCKELVQNLLTFSRQDRKNLEPLDLTEAVSNALLLVETQARVRGVELRRELRSEGLIVSANANQIQQIVINLCTNALDATPQGGSVTVRCLGREQHGQGWARVEVCDTGSGIPAAIRQKIFDPFFTTKDPGRGTGLGLSLVYELVNHHRGRLDYVSAEGRGTTFFVDLPLTAVPAAGEKA